MTHLMLCEHKKTKDNLIKRGDKVATVIGIDPVSGDDILCNCAEKEVMRTQHWQNVALMLAELILDDDYEAIGYARQVKKVLS